MYDIFITGARETSRPVPSVQCARSHVGRVNACLATGETFNQYAQLTFCFSYLLSKDRTHIHTYICEFDDDRNRKILRDIKNS